MEFIDPIEYTLVYTVKPAQVVTSFKQSSVLKGHRFLVTLTLHAGECGFLLSKHIPFPGI
jgi:hypothetical protein